MSLFRAQYRKIIELTLLLTVAVVVLGAWVRLSDAGLGCPDWPGCYGQMWAPVDIDPSSAEQYLDARPYDPVAARQEMAHRLLAGILGLVLLALAALGWRSGLCPLVLSIALLALLATQVALGMLTVTWLLKPLTVTAHLFFAFALALTLWIMHIRDRLRRPHAHGFVRLGGGDDLLRSRACTRTGFAVVGAVGALLFMQIFLGVWMSSQYASLACVGFPACNGQWWPKMDFASAFTLWQGLGVNYEYGVLDSAARKAVHFSHRLNALALVAVSVAAVLLTWRSGSPAPRRSATLFLALLGVQIVLGVVNVTAGLPIFNAVAHTVLALLVALVWLEWLMRLDSRQRWWGSVVAGHDAIVSGLRPRLASDRQHPSADRTAQ